MSKPTLALEAKRDAGRVHLAANPATCLCGVPTPTGPRYGSIPCERCRRILLATIDSFTVRLDDLGRRLYLPERS
ncbi:MAG TPA: hypothetical protein VGM37_14640 [Armatimonadota bacterium]|jgi:hypothetical protein